MTPDQGLEPLSIGYPTAVSCIFTLEPWRRQITQWHAAGIQGTTIHAALKRNHGYTGSYSSLYRFLCQLVLEREPEVPMRLRFQPAEAMQVDFGAGAPDHGCLYWRSLQDLVLCRHAGLVTASICRVCARPDGGYLATGAPLTDLAAA